MSELVERVARALERADAEIEADFARGENGTIADWTEYSARIAIAAMREPTEDMVEAGYRAYARKADDVWSMSPTEEPDAGGGAMGYGFRAMIDAALAEPSTDAPANTDPT